MSGERLQDLARDLSGKPGIDIVAPFGMSLHVSGRNQSSFEKTITRFRADPGTRWDRIEPSLEDVFIELMNRPQDKS